jgi:dCTP diphosphatase
MSDDKTTIADLRTTMKEFIAEREWQKYHTPRNLACSISIEAAELLEHFQWAETNEVLERLKTDAAYRRHVSEEMADVLLYLMSLANALDLDVSATVDAKMAKNRAKYPADQVRGHYQRPLR